MAILFKGENGIRSTAPTLADPWPITASIGIGSTGIEGGDIRLKPLLFPFRITAKIKRKGRFSKKVDDHPKVGETFKDKKGVREKMNIPFRVVTPRNIYYVYADFWEGQDEKGFPRSYYDITIYDQHPRANKKPWQTDHDPIFEFGTIPASDDPPVLLAKRIIKEIELCYKYAEELAEKDNVIRMPGAEKIPVDGDEIEEETVVSDWATGKETTVTWTRIKKLIGKQKRRAKK